MNQDLQNYMDYIKQDYAKWRDGCASGLTFDVEMVPGSKYIKIVTNSHGSRSAHSFICAKDTPKFKKGDILKANSWKAPATNFVRGNILTKTYGNVSWTGCQNRLTFGASLLY